MGISLFGEGNDERDVLFFLMNFWGLISCLGFQRVNEKGCFLVKELDP